MKNLKKAFLFFCFVQIYVSSICVYSQNYKDSLEVYYNNSKKINRNFKVRIKDLNTVISLAKATKNNKYILKGYNRKSFLFYKEKKYDSSFFYTKKLLEKSIETNNSSMLTLAYKRLADYYRLTDNLFLSLKWYKKHKEIVFINKDTFLTIKDLRYMSSLQKKMGFIIESEKTIVEALRLSDLIKSKKEEVIVAKLGIYNHLGTLYRAQENYSKALDLYDKGLLIAKKLDEITMLYNNKANVYLEKKEYDLAIKNFEYVYEKSLELKDKKKIAMSLGNLGLAQSKINHLDALKNLQKSLEIRKKENQLSSLYISYIQFAEYYKDRNNKNKVLFYTNKAYHISKKLNNVSNIVKALSFIIKIDENSKIVEYKKLTDSIAKARLLNVNKHAALKYDYSKKELELKSSEIKQANERFYKLLFLVIGIVLLLITVFTYFILKSRNKKEKLEQVYITETRISQKVHDEVANDIFGMMTKLQVNEKENAVILDDLERVYIKTRDISKENSIIDFTENFAVILQDLLTSYKNNKVNVITRNLNKINWETVSKLKKTTIYRVLQELMTNMRKHSKATIAIISFEEKNKKRYINYKDNGVGGTINKNTGLQNTETRIQSVNGSITFESQTNKGFEVKITI